MGDESPNDAGVAADVVSARPIRVARPVPPAADDPRAMAHLTRRQAALDLALVVIVGLVAPAGFDLAARLSLAAPALPGFDWLIVTRQWFDALLALALAAYLVYRHGLSAAAFGLQSDHFGRQLWWAALTLAGLYGALAVLVLLALALTTLAPGFEEDVVRRKEFLDLLPAHDLTATVFLMLPVAIHEETLFRGLLLPYLRRVGLGWTGAVFLSTAVFALLHVDQGVVGIAQVFGVGLVLAVFFVWSRSLLAVILAHFAFNVVQLQVFARWLMPWLEKLSEGA